MRLSVIFLMCLVMAACAPAGAQPEQPAATAQVETVTPETAVAVETATRILPLPDPTLETLVDSTVHISFGEGDFYRDASGNAVLRMQIYSYEQFDMVEISLMEAGDAIVISGQEILVESVKTNEFGTVLINGGLDEGGFDLATGNGGVFYVHGYSDMKSWEPVCTAEFPVSDSFVYTDSSNLDLGEVTYTVDGFLNRDPELDYGYLPQNTTVRIENGQVMAMSRVYTP